jgi:hypothetical protein
MSETSGSVDPKAQAKADKAYAKATRPWFKKKRFIALGAVALLVVFNAATGDGGSEGGTTDTPAAAESAPAAAESAPAAVEEAALEVTAQKMIEDLEGNALNAAQTYEGKRVIITGKVGNIDASGDYFSLEGTADFSLTFVQIYINDDQVATVSGYTKGQDVTVTGTVTDVGEIIGYSIDAESLS